MEQNKTGKYFKYAIGEIILVVVGILIALSINNWNERRKMEHNRQALIVSLIKDFEFTHNDLIKDELPYMDSMMTNIRAFQKISASKTESIPVDSLRVLAISFFGGISFFNPNLTSYNEAESSGALSLLQNKELMNEFTLFMQYFQVFKSTENQSRYSYYNGASWELRKTVNPGLIFGNSPSTLNHNQYNALINTPLALNTFNNINILKSNMRYLLLKMSEIAERIIKILKEMQVN